MTSARESAQPNTGWLAFITSLPVDNPASRMRVLRTLESLGCAVLREGVYLIPDTPGNRQSLTRLAEHVVRMNGSANLLAVVGTDEAQSRQFRGLFDRSGKYEELSRTIQSLRAGFGISDPTSLSRVLAKQRREYEAISALDFFPSAARQAAEQALQEAEERVRSLMFPEQRTGPHAPDSRYVKRAWATRKPLWGDRLASAWLVRRFVDPESSLVWLEQSEECPHDAVSFGFEGAAFCNTRSRVTFEELLSKFGLDSNPALVRMGALVHCLDAGGTPVAEAPGMETLLQGARRRSDRGDELFAEMEKTFDLLYDAYSESPGSRSLA